MVREVIFENILDQQLMIFWGGSQYYPSEISEQLKSDVSEIYCKRYYFDKMHVNSGYDTIERECIAKLEELIFSNKFHNSYHVCIEYSAEIASRIRSFKGIFANKAFIRDNFLEVEVPFEKKTILGGIIFLTENNYSQNIDKIWNSNSSFIINSSRNYLSQDFLAGIIENYRLRHIRTVLDYPKIISNFCNEGDLIFKIGGYASDESLALDVFQKK